MIGMNPKHLLSTGTLVLALACLLLVAALAWFAASTPQYTLTSNVADQRTLETLFRDDIREFGALQAYERLAVAIRMLPEDVQHGYAHAFGHALYVTEGEPGIVVCDGRFNLGCFHQFLGDAIGDLGTDAITRLYKECGQAIGSEETCQHGLGHGILSGVGYTEADLRHALSLCAAATNEKTYAGCYGGAFMEYNMRTVAEAEGIMLSRRAENNDMYAPCLTMPEDERSVCTFWLPQWWFFSIMQGQRDPAQRPALYSRMGDLCAASPAPQPCYEGIGYITPTVFSFDAEASRSACSLTGAGSLYCSGMAALIFNISTGQKEKAPTVCEGFTGKDAQICTAYATHENNFSFTMPE